jgi:glycosyltransferase involved in cell wall biosynthesis
VGPANPRRQDLAVVICTANRPTLLSRCLDAIADARRTPAEVVVVDVGDPSSIEIVEQRRGLRARHLSFPGASASRARNAGAASVASPLIAFIDDDCLPDPAWTAALVAACGPSVAGVAGRVLPLPGALGVATSSRTSVVPRTFHGLANGPPWEVGTGGNLLLRRTALEEVGGFDETLGPGTPGRAGEDVELIFALLSLGHTLVFEPAALVYHEPKSRSAWIRSRLAYGWGMGAFLTRAPASERRRLRRRYVADRRSRAVEGIRRADPWASVDVVGSLVGLTAALLWRFAVTPRPGSGSRTTEAR